ncbi:hypothetical protein AB4072_03885 [Microvirga sp. 2MCAF38]|uniref:hypothetical protein n=1 Tax=Microvirga sp. 2MCAF38 TaxID=3232989 RepID=UPI003F9E0047
MRGFLSLSVLVLGLSAPALAQQSNCTNAPATQAATPPDPGSTASGTSPGTAGSTGWTGGTGGSYIGTAPKGPSQHSPTEHPATASGLDPMKPATPGVDKKC